MSKNNIRNRIKRAREDRKRSTQAQIKTQGKAKVYQGQNRSKMTNAEWACDQILREIRAVYPQVDYVFQYVFQKGGKDAPFFLLDFYIKPPFNLAIEIDGGYHDMLGQAQRDQWRQSKVEASGIRVLRYRNKDVCFESERVKSEITGIIKRSIEHTNMRLIE